MSLLWLLLLLTPVFASSTDFSLQKRQSNLNSNLASCLSGSNVTTLTSSNTNYANASLAYNRRLKYFPAAIVYPSSPAEIQSVVTCAAGQNVPVVARSGGHSYAAYGLGGQDGALVVDLANLTTINVDPSSGVAVVQTGNKLGDMALAIWNQGQRALPHGTCSYVGVGGHAAYGGYGLFSRSAGLLLDRMVAADVVLANGTSLTVSNSSNSDVFWAIQGAAPSYGIVTSYSFLTLPAPANTVHYQITWPTAIPTSNVVPIFAAFQNFAFSNPSEQLSVIMFIASDHQGSLSITISGTFYGTSSDFQGAIGPLTGVLPGGPNMVTNNYNWIDGLTAVMGNLSTAAKPDTPDDFYAKSIMANTQFSNNSFSSWLQYMTTNGSTIDISWWAQMDVYGGAISSISATATSYAHRDSILNIQFYGYSPSMAFPDDGINFMDGLVSSLDPSPYAAYPNYMDPNLPAEQWHNLYYGSNYQRLTVIKRNVDPNNMFTFPQGIEVAAAGTAVSSAQGSSGSSKSSTSPRQELSLSQLAFSLLITIGIFSVLGSA